MQVSDRALAWGLNGVSIIFAIWGIISTQPAALAICALIPWIALLAMVLTNGRLIVSGSKSETRPDIFLMIVMPAMVVAMQAFLHPVFLDWVPALAAGCVLSVAWTLGFVAVRRVAPPGGIVTTAILLLLGCAYGYGAMAVADTAGDRTVAAAYQPEVQGKRMSTGRHSDYYLTLAPWGAKAQQDYSVSITLFDSVNAGDRVCVDVHPGHLTLKWYEIRNCAPPSPGA